MADPMNQAVPWSGPAKGTGRRTDRGLRWRLTRVALVAVTVAAVAGGASFVGTDAPGADRDEAGIRWRKTTQSYQPVRGS